MAALGIGFAFLTHSQAVLLDGVFSLIGAAVGMVALRVATLVRKPDDDLFHFGYAAYEPTINLAKGLLIAVVSLFAAAAAVDSILRGGRAIQGSAAIGYALIAAAGCLIIAGIQHRLGKKTGSPLLAVDSKNWLIDGLLSGAVAASFVVMIFLEGTRFDWMTAYVDPGVVILLSLLSAPIPISIIRTNWNQLLGRAPDAEIQAEARRRVAEGLAGIEGITPQIRLLQTGRVYYVQLYLIVDQATGPSELGELDAIRERLWKSVVGDSREIGLDVIFTTEPEWVRRTTPSGTTRKLVP